MDADKSSKSSEEVFSLDATSAGVGVGTVDCSRSELELLQAESNIDTDKTNNTSFFFIIISPF